MEKMVCGPAYAAPEEQARYEVAEDRPESILFSAINWIVGHLVMVDEFLALDN